ncbi:hypothetical protein ACJRO7_018439 [Eucalyptus globulus]|uniref:MINDY deubiquitinase domain-containing protein n=1 Tax=Eucalyptus globulus TaxID=34317 RepID=A0ABD3L0E0_EUCGL
MPTPAAPPPEAMVEECLHETKLIKFFRKRARIILQDKNGPCSLLAICNCLILRGMGGLDQNRDEFSLNELLNSVANALIDSNSNIENEDAGYEEYHGQETVDPFELLPALATGLYVNIKFHSVKDFVRTPELEIFRRLCIPLYHGCIVNPQDHDTAIAIGSKSYDELADELADELEDDLVAQNMTPEKRNLFQKFVKSKASLTPYGLSCLRRDVGEGELCVLFHNEHFSTMFKYKGQLYLLATDEAFLDRPNHVWEKLEKVKGGNVYVSSNFEECKMDYVGSMNNATLTVSTNDDIDEQLARSLQEEEFNA